MKAFAFVLLCAFAAVQGRYTALQSTRTAASLGENPWVVHLRLAVASSGLLQTCAGSLIDNSWVLTTASCVFNARFIWLRYGVVNVISPTLVTEASAGRPHPGFDASTGENNVALVNINRFVEEDAYIGVVSLVGQAGDSGTVCAFGAQDGPGEVLYCYQVRLPVEEGSGDFKPSKYDVGAALVSDGVQVALLADESGKFIDTADYVPWIEQETGLVLNPEAVPEVTSEAVHFV